MYRGEVPFRKLILGGHMVTFLILLFVVLTIAAYLFGPFLVKTALVKWAAIDSKYSPLVQKPATGSILPIEKWTDDKDQAPGAAKKVGELATIIVSDIPGYTWNPSTYEFSKNPAPTAAPGTPSAPVVVSASANQNILDELGLAWVGFYRRTWRGSTSYVSWEVGSKGTGGTVEKERKGPEIFFRHTLALNLDKLISNDNTEVNITVVFVIEIRNPHQALFISGAWVKNLYSAITQACKEYVGRKPEAKLRTERDSKKKDLIDFILNLSTQVGADKPGLMETDGIWIVSARFEKFDFGADSPRLREARESVRVAQLGSTAATHDAETLTKLGVAQGARYKEIVAAGPEAIALAGQEAIAKALEKGGATPIVSVGTNAVTPAVVVPSQKP